MSTLKFSDGVTVNTAGSLEPKEFPDGLYVVGDGMLIPVNDMEEANQIISVIKKEKDNV